MEASRIDFQSEVWRQVEDRLAWQYPFSAATQQPAKTSVSALRRQAVTDNEEEAAAIFPRLESGTRKRTGAAPSDVSRLRGSIPKLTAADIGSAHHEFLQLLSLDRAGNALDLAREADRLQKESRLTPEQVAVLDFDALASFWDSDLGRRIRLKPQLVHRELAFTARFTPAELAGMLGLADHPGLQADFVLVQGVVDLAIIAPNDVWLVDFKTDELQPHDLQAKVKTYAPQLKLYAQALSKIYRQPVSASWLYFLALKQAVAI
jgi:ATP-dependent helicase/nuclease subunit A